MNLCIFSTTARLNCRAKTFKTCQTLLRQLDDFLHAVDRQLLFLAPTGAQEMQMLVRLSVCLSEAKCSIAHNLNPLGSDYIKMTSG